MSYEAKIREKGNIIKNLQEEKLVQNNAENKIKQLEKENKSNEQILNLTKNKLNESNELFKKITEENRKNKENINYLNQKLKEEEAKSANNTEIIKKLKDQQKNDNLEKENLKRKLKEKSEIIDKNENELKEYKQRLNKLLIEKENLNKKLAIKEQSVQKLNEDINKLKINNNKEINDLNQKVKDLTLAINKDEGTIKQFHKLGLLKDIKINDNSLIINLNNNQFVQNPDLNNLDDLQLEKFYDVIINIKSINDISNGWEIKMTKEGEENFSKYKNMDAIKVGIIGNSNKGKSFILSRISRIKLPSGTSIKTEGLSIKYPELEEFKDRKLVLLDSAGLETPVLNEENEDKNNKNEIKNESEQNEENEDKNNKNEIKNESEQNEKNEKDINIENNEEIQNVNSSNKEVNNNEKGINANENQKKNNNQNGSENNVNEIFKERSREKLITELFLQNYIIYNSDILIIVVGILSYSEQKLLNKIKIDIKKSKINKPLYIIHNLKTFFTIKQVENYINTNLRKSATFELVKGHNINSKIGNKTGVYFFEKNSNPKIFHLIFANEDSKAGEYYNNFTLDFIENSYQEVTDLKSFDVIQTVKERFIDLSKEIFENETFKIEDIINNDEIIKNRIFKLKTPQKINLKKCLIDELGFSMLKSNGFEPKYNYFKSDNKIIVRVEVPGIAKIKPEMECIAQYTFIKINGNKIIDKFPKNLNDNIENHREFGEFNLEIPLKTEYYKIKNENPKVINKNGLFIIEYNLEEDVKANEYEINDEDI